MKTLERIQIYFYKALSIPNLFPQNCYSDLFLYYFYWFADFLFYLIIMKYCTIVDFGGLYGH